jgi:hypothetical protein
MNDWLSIALTFTVTCGAALDAPLPLPEPVLGVAPDAGAALGAALEAGAALGVALRSVSLIWTLGGGV